MNIALTLSSGERESSLGDNKSKRKQVVKKVYKKLSSSKFYVNTKTALRPLQLKWVFAIMYTLVSPLLFALLSWLTKELLEQIKQFLWFMVWIFFFVIFNTNATYYTKLYLQYWHCLQYQYKEYSFYLHHYLKQN